jgi:hypothetical protein
MRQLIIAGISVLLLVACSTPQERAAQNQAEMARIMAEYGPACNRLGYAPNSDQWRNCILRLHTNDEIRNYSYSSPAFYGGFGRPYWGGGMWGPYW